MSLFRSDNPTHQEAFVKSLSYFMQEPQVETTTATEAAVPAVDNQASQIVNDGLFPYACTEPGCNRRFANKHGIAMHQVRTHSMTKEQRTKIAKAVNATRYEGKRKPGKRGKDTKPRRSYNRHVDDIVAPTPVAPEAANAAARMNYCPCCGAHLRAVPVALRMPSPGNKHE